MNTRIYLLFALALLLNACGNSKNENADLKSQVDNAKLNAQLDNLQKQLVESKARETSLADKLAEVQKDNLAIKEELAVARGQIDILQALKKEADQRTTNEVAVKNNKNPIELDNFMSGARRMVAAYETGLSYNDFESRLIDLKASAQEAISSIKDQEEKSKIADFVSALDDAYSMLIYKAKIDAVPVLDLLPPEDRIYFVLGPKDNSYVITSPQGLHARAIKEGALNENWRNNSMELIKKYNFQITTLDDSRHVLLLSGIVPKVLSYAKNEFDEIDASTKK